MSKSQKQLEFRCLSCFSALTDGKTGFVLETLVTFDVCGSDVSGCDRFSQKFGFFISGLTRNFRPFHCSSRSSSSEAIEGWHVLVAVGSQD